MTAGELLTHECNDGLTFVANVAETERGKSILRTANGIKLLICNVSDNIFVVENLCSHMRRELGVGRLHGHLVTCPVHLAQFDVRDGSAKCFPASRPIRHFEVELRGDQIWVKLPPV